MPPKHRQLCTPCPKLARNAHNSLVDLPGDRTSSIIDGRDGKVDATDNSNAVNASQCISTTPALPEQLLDDAAQLVQITNLYTTVAMSMRDYVQKTLDDMRDLLIKMRPHSNGDPPLHLQQPAPKPSIFPSDSDSQHSFTYLCEFPESFTLISLISVVKSEFSRVLAHPTTRNATKTSPTPRPTAQTVWERVPSPCGPS
jgi:hypothetical protein